VSFSSAVLPSIVARKPASTRSTTPTWSGAPPSQSKSTRSPGRGDAACHCPASRSQSSSTGTDATPRVYERPPPRTIPAPTAKQYEKALRAFKARFPYVRNVVAWNEINHFTQPTSRSPASAAKFTNTVAKLCKSCKIVVADVLDQADDPTAKNPKFTNTAKYIKTFRKYLKVSRGICGIHNYSDVNRFRSTGTKALMSSLGCKEYWLTETGGLYNFGSFWSKKTYKGCSKASSCQLKATKYMFSLAKANKKIKRLYVYTWFGAVTPRFDAGLVANGQPRPALTELRKYV